MEQSVSAAVTTQQQANKTSYSTAMTPTIASSASAPMRSYGMQMSSQPMFSPLNAAFSQTNQFAYAPPFPTLQVAQSKGHPYPSPVAASPLSTVLPSPDWPQSMTASLSPFPSLQQVHHNFNYYPNYPATPGTEASTPLEPTGASPQPNYLHNLVYYSYPTTPNAFSPQWGQPPANALALYAQSASSPMPVTSASTPHPSSAHFSLRQMATGDVIAHSAGHR